MSAIVLGASFLVFALDPACASFDVVPAPAGAAAGAEARAAAMNVARRTRPSARRAAECVTRTSRSWPSLSLVSAARRQSSPRSQPPSKDGGDRRPAAADSVVAVGFAGADPEGADPRLEGGGLEGEELRRAATAVDPALGAAHRAEDVGALAAAPLSFGNNLVGRGLPVVGDFARRRGDDLVLSVAARDREGVRARRLEQIERSTGREAVAAKHLQRVSRDGLIERPLVLGEALPHGPGEPGRAPRPPQPLIAVGERLGEERLPGIGHRMGIEPAGGKIPLVMTADFEIPARHVISDIGNRFAQGALRILHAQRIHDGPETFLVVREARRKERNDDLEKILLVRVDMTEV